MEKLTDAQVFWTVDLIQQEVLRLKVKAQRPETDSDHKERIEEWVKFWGDTLAVLSQYDTIRA